MTTTYHKLKISLKWRLVGAKYYKALAAFEFAENCSLGETRKDGVTPEFEHQVRIALFAFTLKRRSGSRRFAMHYSVARCDGRLRH